MADDQSTSPTNGQHYTEAAPFKCKTCGGHNTVALPKTEIVTKRNYSICVAAHENPIVCVHCGQQYYFAMTACESTWDAIPFKGDEKKPLIIPGSAFHRPPFGKG